MAKTPKTSHELQQELATLYAKVRDGKVDLDRATVLSKIAGKQIAMAAVDVKYAVLQGKPTSIPFLKPSK